MPQQSCDQRILSIADLLNIPAPGSKHTGMSFVQRAINWTLLPVTIYEFDDGYYIVDAINKKLIGHDVLSIEGMPIDSVASRLEPWGFSIFVEPMQAAGVVDQINNIALGLKSSDDHVMNKNIEPGGVWSPSLLLYAKSRQTPIKDEWSPAEDIRAGRFEQAAQRLRSAHSSGFKLDSWVSRDIIEKTDNLEELGRPQEALPYVKLAVELFPQSWRAHSRLGYTYESLEENTKAIEAYKKVLKLNPSLSTEADKKLKSFGNNISIGSNQDFTSSIYN